MRQQGFKGRHLLVIVNPMSGHKQGRVLWEKVEVLLKKGDVPYHLEMTKYGGHARDLVLGAREKEIRALDCSKCSGILVIGGDGTVCEVLNAVMQREDTETALKQLVVGTVPAGSECAFAKMTTFLDPYSATWVLLKGHRVSGIDVMRITQGKMVMHSVCGIGWGLGGKLAEESEALRDTFGPARYLVSGIKSFVKLRGCPGTLKMLVPTLPQPLPSSVEACKFGSGRKS
jgi:diacylglycerol kinase family enzyme